MKLQLILILITALAGVAGAEMLTIQTDPPGCEVWVNGEACGIAPVTVNGPFEGDTAEVSAEYGGERVTTIIGLSDADIIDIVVVVETVDLIKDPPKNQSPSILLGGLAGLFGGAVVAIVVGLLVIIL